jgi:ribosomal protein L37AE/L43A
VTDAMFVSRFFLTKWNNKIKLMQDEKCVACKSAVFDYIGAGLRSCTQCGMTLLGQMEEYGAMWCPNEQMVRSCYTRLRRFKKYLSRACHMQSCSTVPDETWEYLFARVPFNGPKSIMRCLKKSKLKRKCYDSLALMTKHLCSEWDVPSMTDGEFRHALEMFGVVDEHFKDKKSFCSYLYVLEYILRKMGRDDIVPFVSVIQCCRRRNDYQSLLDRIFCKYAASS